MKSRTINLRDPDIKFPKKTIAKKRINLKKPVPGRIVTMEKQSGFNFWSTLFTIIVTSIIAGGAVYVYMDQARQPVIQVPVQKDLSQNISLTDQNNSSSIALAPTSTFLAEVKPTGFLYVSAGDLWQSDLNGQKKVKLIKGGNISAAAYSSSKKWIAYIKEIKEQKKLTNAAGKLQTQTLIRKELVVSDDKGSFSFLIKDAVNRWGWIPSTDLLWYEGANLGQWPSWNYWGANDVWTFDPLQLKADLLVKSSDILDASSTLQSPIWSPDGLNLLLVAPHEGQTALQVYNRETKEIKYLINNLPEVGVSSNGQKPVPLFYWANDGQSVYAFFVPIDPNDKNYQANALNGLRLPLDGSKPLNLFNTEELTNSGLNSDTLDKIALNPNYSQAAYVLFSGVTAEATSSTVYYSEKLVFSDLINKSSEVILENIGSSQQSQPWSVSRIYLGQKSIYLISPFLDKNTKFSIKVIDLQSKKIQDLDTTVINQAFLNKAANLVNLYFYPSENLFYLMIGNKLFIMQNNQLKLLLDKVDGVNVY